MTKFAELKDCVIADMNWQILYNDDVPPTILPTNSRYLMTKRDKFKDLTSIGIDEVELTQIEPDLYIWFLAND